MITIALDEAGVFDAGIIPKESDSKTTLIGGVYFDDKEIDGETTRERDRIISYYKAVFSAVNEELSVKHSRKAKFPENLHWQSNASDEINSLVMPVKKKVSESIAQFMTEGTFLGAQLCDKEGMTIPERKGAYSVCAIVKSKRGKENYLSKELGDFFRDDKASNCYLHMMSDLTNHLIFNNPINFNARDFSILFASRQTGGIEGPHFGEYENNGYEQKSIEHSLVEESKRFYEVMNKDILRTLMSEQFIANEGEKMHIDAFRVPSISYRDNSANRCAWLYLADSICGYLTFEIDWNDVTEVDRRSNKLCKNSENLVFAYDEIDIKLSKAFKKFKEGNYYESLKNIFFIKQQNDDISKFYASKWVRYIESHIVEKSNVRLLGNALDQIRLMSNEVDNNREFEIFKTLERAIMNNSQTHNGWLLLKLNNIGMTLYNHRGDSKKAKEYFNKCEEYKSSGSYEEYISCRNRYTTSIIDGFKYDEATLVAKDTVKALNCLIEASEKAFGKSEIVFGKKELGKTYSMLGQIYSHIDAKVAKEYFEKADDILKSFTADRLITKSYYIHLLINNKETDLYRLQMREYTSGREKVTEQLDYIYDESQKNNPRYNLNFAFYLIIKGMYVLDPIEVWRECWDRIIKIEKHGGNAGKHSHPWEIIYKYLILMAEKLGDIKRYELYKKYLENCIRQDDDDNLVKCISDCSQALVLEHDGKFDKANEIFNQLYCKMVDLYGDDFSKEKNPSIETMKNVISRKLDYMYS